jgi:hypothetical protein
MRASASANCRRLILLMVAACALLRGAAQAQVFYQNIYDYTVNNGTITITGYAGSGGALSIPSTFLINDVNMPVTSIGADAFSGSSLTSVTIPDSVTSIGTDAFSGYGPGSTPLTSVTIGNGVTSIGDYAFAGISIPGYAYFPSTLSSITIPNSVISIGDEAFYVCTDLTSVTIPNSVTSIGVAAFSYTGLTSVTIGNGVTSIGDATFFFCYNLSSVYFTGNAPTVDTTDSGLFGSLYGPTVYYLPGTIGWGSVFAGAQTVMLNTLTITTPPSSAAVVAGANAIFTVTAIGGPAPSYQWQVSTDGGNTWNNVSGNLYAGTTTANLTINNATTTQLGYQYQAVLTNPAGTITTTPVPLVVGTSNAKITWLQNNFTSVQLGKPNIVGDTAEPASDGIPNLLKYAFNLNPWVDGHPFLPQPTLSAGNLTLSFQAPQSDLTYTVQASTDLLNWSATGVTQTNDPTNGSVMASFSLPGNAPAFLQIVSRPHRKTGKLARKKNHDS